MHRRIVRRAKLSQRTQLLAVATLAASMTGCASMKSPASWFQRDDLSAPTTGDLSEPPSFTSTLSNTGKGITGQFKSMGSAVTSAMGKAKTAVTSTFTQSSNPDDPISLANMPTVTPEILVANGQIFEARGNYPKALDNYTKALEEEPTNESALLACANIYARRLSLFDQAAEFYSKALAVAPTASTYNELALCQYKMNRLAEAEASWKKAIELAPQEARYRNNLASLLVNGGRAEEALTQLQGVFDPAKANYNVAYLHFRNQNLAAAQQHLQVALQVDPNLADARLLLDKISGSQSVQQVASAYNTANGIYKTAQALVQPGVSATQVPYAQSNPATTQSVSTGQPTTQMVPQPPTSPPSLQQPIMPSASTSPAGSMQAFPALPGQAASLPTVPPQQ